MNAPAKEPNNLIYLWSFSPGRTCWKRAFPCWCADADLMTQTIKTAAASNIFISVRLKCWIPPSSTDPASIFVSFPSPHLPSLPPSLCIFSLFFFSLWTAYCSILKVPACVLSCPLLPSMHRSDLELCRLRMGAHFWCRERGGGRTGRRYDAALYTPFNGFPQRPLLSSIWKGLFSALPFFSFWPWNSVHEAEKKGRKKLAFAANWVCEAAHCPDVTHTHSHRRKQQLSGEKRCASVCLPACVCGRECII